MKRENNVLPYNNEYNALVVLQILCLLPEVSSNRGWLTKSLWRKCEGSKQQPFDLARQNYTTQSQ